MTYINRCTTSGTTTEAAEIFNISTYGVDKHSICREQMILNLYEYEKLLLSGKQHLCAYLTALIHWHNCRCDVCKEMYLRYIDRKYEYDIWLKEQR